MSFLNAPILWLLFALSLPIIIHLLNRRRHRIVQWAAMAFLLKATRESRGRKKLKHILILTSRALAIAALVFAVARPLVGGFLGWGGNNVDTIILVLDRSLTMESEQENGGKTKRQEILTQVKSTLKKIGTPKLILIDSATASPQLISAPDSLDQLSSTAATDTTANIPALMEKAQQHLLAMPEAGNSEIWVASDLQASNWKPTDELWQTIRAGIANLPQPPKLRVIALTSVPKNNLSLVIEHQQRSKEQITFEFTIYRYDEQPDTDSVDVTFNLLGKQFTKSFNVSGQSTIIRHSIDLPSDLEGGYGHLALPPDANNRDNYAFYAFGKDAPTHTLIVSDGSDAPTYFNRAASLPGFTNQSAEILAPANFNPAALDTTSLVIWQAPLPQGDNAISLTQFIADGGCLLLFPPTTNTDTEFMGIRWNEPQMSQQGEYFIINDWEQHDGPTRNYSNGSKIPLDQLHAVQRLSFSGELTTLATWDDAQPFLARIIHGKGRAILCNTLPDFAWSDLEYGHLLVPLVQRTLTTGNRRFNAKYNQETGRKTPIALSKTPATNVTNVGEITRAFSQDTQAPANAIFQAGIQRWGNKEIALNRPATEDDPTLLTEEQLDSVLESTDYSLFLSSKQQRGQQASSIWQIFLVAALLFLIIEAVLTLNRKPHKAESKP